MKANIEGNHLLIEHFDQVSEDRRNEIVQTLQDEFIEAKDKFECGGDMVTQAVADIAKTQAERHFVIFLVGIFIGTDAGVKNVMKGIMTDIINIPPPVIETPFGTLVRSDVVEDEEGGDHEGSE